MNGIEYVPSETRAIIERMCGYLDDSRIAEFVGCATSTVEHIRSRITRPKRGRPPRQDHVIATKSNILDRSITAADSRNRLACQIGSDALLRRQLETGQHELSADQFYAICFGKGWMDREPARKSGG